jgi:hypothetical protein
MSQGTVMQQAQPYKIKVDNFQLSNLEDSNASSDSDYVSSDSSNEVADKNDSDDNAKDAVEVSSEHSNASEGSQDKESFLQEIVNETEFLLLKNKFIISGSLQGKDINLDNSFVRNYIAAHSSFLSAADADAGF